MFTTRDGDDITCQHSQHYDPADGLPICHDGSQGRRCEGHTVQCGKGHAPCERHADRRDLRPLAVENVERAVAQGVGSALPVVDARPTPGTYTPTLTIAQTVAVELALEARRDTLRALRRELVANKLRRDTIADIAAAQRGIDSIDETIKTTEDALTIVKRTPADSVRKGA